MVKSQITQAIDQVISAGIHPILKEQGFKKQGRAFYKRVADLYHVVHVQGSLWNEFDTGRFTINLGLSSPEIAAEWFGGRLPKSPASHRNRLFYERIGSLLPVKADHWWSIGLDTDLAELAQEVGDALRNYGLKFLEWPAFRSTQDLLGALERDELPLSLFGAPTIRTELLGVLLHRAGRVDEAKTVLTNLIAGKEHTLGLKGYVNRIRALGTRLGLAL
ncbi:MAG: hypothetical protein PWR24_1933 [Desulfonauticus sp.]|nr:MAG: hypothetical protein XD41_1891 [Desulfonauticus sp. 38_4375]MDK2922376.1 hypothetical protein [Desulfonauticus sp.]